MLFGQEHVERYRATDGAEGHEWQGTQTLLLTTTGRKWPAYDEYQQRTDREIPVVVLERVAAG